MRTPKAVGTKPQTLVKVRENAGYSVEEVAKKCSIQPNILHAWENGEKIPTFKQLSKLSEIYRYPSAFFFVDEIPNEAPTPPDYRIMPGRTINNLPEIKREIKDAYERREIAIELTHQLNDYIPKFTLNCSIEDKPEKVASMIRDYLGISIEEQFKWRKDKYTAFNNWRNILEEKGILIFQFTGISPKEIRGYSINKHPLPVIGINTGDKVKARNFSIFHELIHIISDTEGICDMKNQDKRIERFCDEVAANFLVPLPSLLSDELVHAHDSPYWEDSILNTLSNKYSVSKEVILLSLLKAEKTTWKIYRQIKSTWNKKSNDINKPKIPYHIKVRSWNGNYYTNVLLDAYHDRLINRHDLSNYMGGIKWEHIEKMGG